MAHLWPACFALLVLCVAHGSRPEGSILEGITACGEGGLLSTDVGCGGIEEGVGDFDCS